MPSIIKIFKYGLTLAEFGKLIGVSKAKKMNYNKFMDICLWLAFALFVLNIINQLLKLN